MMGMMTLAISSWDIMGMILWDIITIVIIMGYCPFSQFEFQKFAQDTPRFAVCLVSLGLEYMML